MEEKKKINFAPFKSIADGFDEVVSDNHRGYKTTCASAAMLMFLAASDEDRQKYVDAVKVAEGRGDDGSVLSAALTYLTFDLNIIGQIKPSSSPGTPKRKRAAKKRGQDESSGGKS